MEKYLFYLYSNYNIDYTNKLYVLLLKKLAKIIFFKHVDLK